MVRLIRNTPHFAPVGKASFGGSLFDERNRGERVIPTGD